MGGLRGPLIRGAITREAKGPGGRPRFDPMLMFKALVLQRLHGLADDATSFQITDHNSFRAFLAHLQKEHGLALAKEGVMVDASFAEVPWQRNSREDNAQIKGASASSATRRA